MTQRPVSAPGICVSEILQLQEMLACWGTPPLEEGTDNAFPPLQDDSSTCVRGTAAAAVANVLRGSSKSPSRLPAASELKGAGSPRKLGASGGCSSAAASARGGAAGKPKCRPDVVSAACGNAASGVYPSPSLSPSAPAPAAAADGSMIAADSGNCGGTGVRPGDGQQATTLGKHTGKEECGADRDASSAMTPPRCGPQKASRGGVTRPRSGVSTKSGACCFPPPLPRPVGGGGVVQEARAFAPAQHLAVLRALLDGGEEGAEGNLVGSDSESGEDDERVGGSGGGDAKHGGVPNGNGVHV